MADTGLCKGCKKKHVNRTFKCINCDDKFCTSCKVKAGPKCPTCGKITVKPNN